MHHFELRDYQIKIATEAAYILLRKKIVCLFMQVRCGKTVTALQTCKNFGAKKILFITKIKAFSSIENDYKNFGYNFDLTVINKESLHKIETNDFDVVVCDEVQMYNLYPKQSTFNKLVNKRFGNLPMIFLSGTPTSESFSQYYHLFKLSNYSPFKEINFYKWAKIYVNIKTRNLGYAKVNDYSEAYVNLIEPVVKNYILTFTQQQAGFKTEVKENILTVEMNPIIYKLIKRLRKDRVIVSEKTGKTILADTGAKLQQKVHQLFSGTVKFEDGTIQVIDNSKAIFIKERFKYNKIAIFYKFVAELECLQNVLNEKLTTDLEEFNATDKWIALQIISGREGISLKMADYLVYYNIDFSSVSYWQSRDRLTTKDRLNNEVFWIFAKGGIEPMIYKSVINKKNYTLKHFENDIRKLYSE